MQIHTELIKQNLNRPQNYELPVQCICTEIKKDTNKKQHK